MSDGGGEGDERSEISSGRLANYDGARARAKLSKGCSSPVRRLRCRKKKEGKRDQISSPPPSYPTLLEYYSPGAWAAAAAAARPPRMPRARAGRSGCPQWRGSLFATLSSPLELLLLPEEKKTDARSLRLKGSENQCAACLFPAPLRACPRCLGSEWNVYKLKIVREG